MILEVATRGASARAVASVVPQLVKEKIASRIFSKDATVWGEQAEAEASIRLGWVDAANESLGLIPELQALRDELREKGLTRIVLCGMGGSSLAPEVFAATAGVDLVVLDSTYPAQVLSAVSNDIEHTVVVVSSKSGATVETDSQKRMFEQSFDRAGISRIERIFIVTDPNSPMHKQAVLDGYRVFLANPNVGGRFSALTAFGIVPSVLAGVEMEPILQDAVLATELISRDDPNNPALILAAALARSESAVGFKDKLGLVTVSGPIVGFGNWLEQLIAESTGKIGCGILPVVLESSSPELLSSPEDMVTVSLGGDVTGSDFDVSVAGGLGAQILLWEVAIAVAARLLGVNPFDQPDVEFAKIASRNFLESRSQQEGPLFTESGISVSVKTLNLSSGSSLKEALGLLLEAVDFRGYTSIHAYLDRDRDMAFESLRGVIAMKTSRPTTFGWGPRFLHSTGQYHKGGPAQGVFLQLIGETSDELLVPNRNFGFQELMDSQAAGDANVLAAVGRPVLTLRFQDAAGALLVISNTLNEL